MTSDELSKLLLTSACDLQGEIRQARTNCRETHRKLESNDQNILRIAVDGLLAVLARRMFTKIETVTAEISYQIGLSASFIRTHYLCTDLLLEGEQIEAVVLLRKNLEVLARLIELNDEPLDNLLKKTPNVKHVLVNGTGKIYGHLSEVAHFSTPSATDLLYVTTIDERRGPSLVPVYQNSIAEYIDLSHFLALRFAQWKLQRFAVWHVGADFSAEHEAAFRAIAHAVKVGVLLLPEGPNV